ncbi:MAG TPA: hypothetical protein VFS89_03875 [Nitrosospira sp.]|nr:hypothetical protein [Nitrosospira sp.]
MIKFIDRAFVAGVLYTPGMIAEFDAPTESALIADGDATDYPAVAKPVEVLSSSAVAVSCASTASDEVLASFTIDAGTLGVNSILQVEPLWTFTNSANNKILKIKIGGTTVYTATRTTTTKEAPLIVLANRNSLASQIQPYDSIYVTAGTGTPATYTIDFAAAVDVEITGQRANGADTLKLEYFRVLHFVGD